jgi:hypothetical protein
LFQRRKRAGYILDNEGPQPTLPKDILKDRDNLKHLSCGAFFGALLGPFLVRPMVIVEHNVNEKK